MDIEKLKKALTEKAKWYSIKAAEDPDWAPAIHGISAGLLLAVTLIEKLEQEEADVD